MTATKTSPNCPAAFRRPWSGALMAAAVLAWLAVPGAARAAEEAAGEDPHAKVLSDDQYPSASKCAECHEDIYKEWSVSNHAYASISPMFHKFEQALNKFASGTLGSFCVRCHAQVGTQMGEAREKPIWERSQVAREGITCITCHRVEEEFGKVNGERRVTPGEIFEPVSGAGKDSSLANVIENKGDYRVATTKDERGAQIHLGVRPFSQIGKSEFCVSCHQVAVNLGIKLEVVWDQYRDSPARKAGVTCQDCHMSKDPGKATGFRTGPAAVVAGKPINPGRARKDHSFFGPGYPIAHPGIFPHNPDAQKWTAEEWLAFDYRAPWGNSDWEDKVENEEVTATFPDAWSDRSDREEAREVINANLELLTKKKADRLKVMENGMRIDGPFFDEAPTVGDSWKFAYKITNIDDGHNLPSGSLGAQPELWLNVALVDPDGKNVFESGYIDSIGDMADLHSFDVAQGKIKRDLQLFNLQTKFLTTNVKGTDREMYLPVQFDIDQLPHLRPANVPTTVLNHPPLVRMEGRSIPPLGSRMAKYRVPSDAITKPGKYKLSVRMRSRAEPMYFMRFVGATVDMEQSMNQWMIDIHPYTVEIDVK